MRRQQVRPKQIGACSCFACLADAEVSVQQSCSDQKEEHEQRVWACRPATSSAAINGGIAELKAGRPEHAIELFQAALELPGNGAMRLAGTVREYR